MKNDPFPFSHLSQKQLGQLFGVTSHKIGRWLNEVGLRDFCNQPTAKATSEGFMKMVSIEDGPHFPSWDKELTVAAFEAAGHQRIGSSQEVIAEEVKLHGPFVARSKGGGDVFEIADTDGVVVIWCRGERLATRLAEILGVADKFGKLN